MPKKLKMHARVIGALSGTTYAPTACGYEHRREITTIVKRRVTCLTCLKCLRRNPDA